MTSSKRLKLENGVLEILSVANEDVGGYRCKASNSLGEIRKTVELALTGNVDQKSPRSWDSSIGRENFSSFTRK